MGAGSYLLWFNNNPAWGATNKIYWSMMTTSGASLQIGSANNMIDFNTWQLITATWDGTTMRLYKNGEKIAEGLLSGSIGNVANLRIASNPYGDKMDEFRIYGRALTQEEILKQYQGNYSYDMTSGDPVVAYNFNTYTGTAIYNNNIEKRKTSETYYVGEKGEEIADYSHNYSVK
ncbi:MAG: LamG domain-containing protein, partial [Candidatus Omnitrophota bacterium]|nr:LamG domain-containing protein [Candidatus Omnitrophota bacterium]